ncbi:ABC transporter substrate-binding protein [Microbacterium pseudoresistens]|uniref:4,5-dihydroxyphthalate decarboxylase n=1 Tax=Microbacterium pseudoresistens TaxID=640634 RepID=A0A7Y9EVS8_9MICO|nr:hypothetical protein [Microbacterium pseudoresistens]NYD54870.1 4,5-dihydroxyphthalate decarboxylase [Microbacterium pseudoresistens]
MRLSLLTREQGANRALITGGTAASGIGYEQADEPVLVTGFRKMVRSLEFDVAEMAITTYLTAKEHGGGFTALPIFLVRDFHHGATQVRAADAGRRADSLNGARIGVNRGYTVTTGVWGRGALADAGLDLDSVTWVRSGDEHVASYAPPTNVVQAPDGVTLEEMLLSGDLDAVVGAALDHPDVAPLITDPDDAAAESVETTGVFPINHLVVIRDELLAEHASLAEAVFTDFATAKRGYLEQLADGRGDTRQDRVLRRVAQITGADPLPYGIDENRTTLNALIEHAMSQHIIRSAPALDAVFEPSTFGLIG